MLQIGELAQFFRDGARQFVVIEMQARQIGALAQCCRYVTSQAIAPEVQGTQLCQIAHCWGMLPVSPLFPMSNSVTRTKLVTVTPTQSVMGRVVLQLSFPLVSRMSLAFSSVPQSLIWHRKFCLCSPISLPKFLVPKRVGDSGSGIATVFAQRSGSSAVCPVASYAVAAMAASIKAIRPAGFHSLRALAGWVGDNGVRSPFNTKTRFTSTPCPRVYGPGAAVL